MTVDVFQQALQLHQQGQLREAEIGYRQCLEQNPNHADALHLLGVIAHQFGHHSDAVELICRAVSIYPSSPAYHSNLAEAYRAIGRSEEAVASCHRALQIEPRYPEALNNLGLALLRLGRLDEAESAFRRALEANSDFAGAWNNLGQALREQGRTADAIDAYRAAVRIGPGIAETHNNLGQLLLEEDEVDEALIHCREAVRLRPGFPEGQSNLGNVLREQGKLEAAKACYHEALRLNPRIGMVYNNMAQALQEGGQLDEAIRWYQQALEREPDTPRFHNNLASALAEQEDLDRAIEHYRTALRSNSDSHEAWTGLGCVYRDQEKHGDSAQAFREAIRVKPDFAPAHNGLGQTLAEMGELDDAYDCFRQATVRDAKLVGAWYNLATHHPKRLTPDDVNRIEALLAAPWLKPGARASVHFALAHVLDLDRDYANSARAMTLANQQQAISRSLRGETYDPAEHEAFVDQVIELFDADWFNTVALANGERWGLESDVPVLIVGMPRSGTTLTEQIIASHPDAHGAGELRLARNAFESVVPEPEQSWPVRFRSLSREFVRASASSYLDQLLSLAPNARRIVDKMPDNYLYLGWIVSLLPKARIIHCRRDPGATALSCWLTSFRSIRWANDPEHIAHRFSQYQRLMAHWRRCLPVPMLEMDYERTVADLPAVARELIDWIGLPWDDRCVEFHATTRPVRTASVSQVRQPVYTRSADRWKNYQSLLPELFEPLSLAVDEQHS